MRRKMSIFFLLRLLLAAAVLPGGELEDEAVSLTLKLERRLWEPGPERDKIFWRIQEIGPEARVAVPTLLKLLEQEGPRASAARTLEGIGGEAVPQLVDALDHDDAAVRLQLCKSLAAIGADARSAVDPVIKLLENEPDLSVRRQALLTLGRIGGSLRTALATLQKAMLIEDTAAAAATALQHFDVDAGVSIDVLLKANKHKSPSARLAALECLAKFDRCLGTCRNG